MPGGERAGDAALPGGGGPGDLVWPAGAGPADARGALEPCLRGWRGERLGRQPRPPRRGGVRGPDVVGTAVPLLDGHLLRVRDGGGQFPERLHLPDAPGGEPRHSRVALPRLQPGHRFGITTSPFWPGCSCGDGVPGAGRGFPPATWRWKPSPDSVLPGFGHATRLQARGWRCCCRCSWPP
jgi:hypothetical protein